MATIVYQCGPSNCGGCCSANVCVGGTDHLKCGVGGGACKACTSKQICDTGTCAATTSCFVAGTPVTLASGSMKPIDDVLAEPVTSVETVNGGVSTYNFEVETYHTYFVDGVLVHNIKAGQ